MRYKVANLLYNMEKHDDFCTKIGLYNNSTFHKNPVSIPEYSEEDYINIFKTPKKSN